MLKYLAPSRRRAARTLPVAAFILLATLTPAIASAHVVVYPKKSTTGTYERYVVRVPNEEGVATTRVEIRFPEGVRVTEFQDMPGWTLQVLTDSTKRIVGAVWTGNLPPKRFAEFVFLAANPKTATSLVWPVTQTYQGQPAVAWTGPKGSKTPAPVTVIALTDSSAGSAATSAATPETPATVVNGGSPGASPFQWVQWLALVIAIIALGAAIRPRNKGA